jgi:TM2 domain-containing membrane protein YozV
VSGGPQPYSPYATGYPGQGIAGYGATGYGAAGYGPGTYGVEPNTGLPYSDKSKVTAGLLQLLLGIILVGGVGRLYSGNVGLGVAQLVVSFVAWFCFFCGFFVLLPWIVTFGAWVWFIVDGILVLTGRPVDGQGRPLRS